jgi:hypothetical protein
MCGRTAHCCVDHRSRETFRSTGWDETLRAGEAVFFSKEEAERREISCEGDGVWAKLGLSKGRGPTKQWNVVFEDETEKWMMDSDIYAFVKTDTRGQIEVHSSDSENERRQLEQEEDSDAAGTPRRRQRRRR